MCRLRIFTDTLIKSGELFIEHAVRNLWTSAVVGTAAGRSHLDAFLAPNGPALTLSLPSGA